MPAPSPLSIATSSLRRLIKEEASYHSEMVMQQKSIDRLEASSRSTTTSAATEGGGGGGREEDGDDDDDDERGNQEFMLRQEV